MEVARAAAGAGADAVGLAAAGLAAGAAAMAPESISDFLLLRVFLVLVALVSAGVALADSAAGAAAPLSAATFLLLRVFLVAAGSLAVVLADSVAAVSDFLLFFFAAVSLLAEVSELAASVVLDFAFLLLADFFLAVVVDAEVSAAADSLADGLASFFVFFFFFLEVVVEAWSSVELVWGPAIAVIPLSTKNMQSATVHILSLVCSLFMISSLVPGRSQGTAEACLRGTECFPTGRKGRP